jgi:hypothetical protein
MLISNKKIEIFEVKDPSKLKDVLKNMLNEWTDWSDCIGTCDYATQKRSRLCQGLANCGESGVEEEVRPCFLPNCSSIALGKCLFINN